MFGIVRDMKALLLVIGVVVTGVVVYTWLFSGESTVTNYPLGSTGPVVAFGDSLVSGVGAAPGNDFVSVLSEQIDEPILNLGQSGDTTQDGVNRIDAVLEQEPRLVIILFGGNDFLQRIPPEETFANLGVIIERIHRSGAAVMLLGVRGGLLRDEYRSQYDQLSETYQTAYIPNVLDGLFGTPEVMSDPVHPNDKGHQLIAEKILPELELLLN